MEPFVVLLGPPGSGKGTQGRQLAARFGLPYLATGDVVREAMKRPVRNAWYRARHVRYAAGTPQPDSVMNRLLAEKLKEVDVKNGIVFDAYPLSLGQIKGYERLVKSHRGLPLVLALKVSQKEVVKRLGLRKFCPKCNLSYLPASKDAKRDICHMCKQPLIVRKDDTREAVVKRYREYARRLKPMLAYFKKQGWLYEINGEGKVEEIQEEMREIIKDNI